MEKLDAIIKKKLKLISYQAEYAEERGNICRRPYLPKYELTGANRKINNKTFFMGNTKNMSCMRYFPKLLITHFVRGAEKGVTTSKSISGRCLGAIFNIVS